MLKLRLKRCGRKKQPFYKIVVMNANSRRDGFAIEELGFYNPLNKTFKINKGRTIYRLKQGVQPTATLIDLLKKVNILTTPNIK
jgi:small subunit ribosomal protein S16|uniref:Small ribosomal subunit protein bS16c n=1 Tax=Vaucheria litorea TaxID=109269 RepID=B7T1T4_VAULI|nr:ribosomal protein S16 [Vaucheria litorea]ACF70900.1 ribosomal protein S16 [Vaucheria litorea]